MRRLHVNEVTLPRPTACSFSKGKTEYSHISPQPVPTHVWMKNLPASSGEVQKTKILILNHHKNKNNNINNDVYDNRKQSKMKDNERLVVGNTIKCKATLLCHSTW
jgi:hypothetical protein